LEDFLWKCRFHAHPGKIDERKVLEKCIPVKCKHLRFFNCRGKNSEKRIPKKEGKWKY
jgi:hypothetical protein